MRLHLLRRLVVHVLADVLPELLEAAFCNAEHLRQAVIDGRQGLFLNAVCLDREFDFLTLQVFRVVVLGELDLEGLLVAGLDTREPFLEVRQHLALPKNHGHFLALPAFDEFAFELSGKIDNHAIAVRALAFNFGPGGFLLSEVLDHVVEITVADFDVGFLYLDLVEVLQLDLGHDLEGRDIGEILAVIAALGLDLRAACRIQVLLLHGIRVTLLHQLGQHFLANLRAIPLPDDLGRYLARPESLDFYGLANGLEPGVDLFFDALGGQLDAHAPFQRSHRFDCDLHFLQFLKRRRGPRKPLVATYYINYNRLDSESWCERRDSNSHGLPHWHLKPARLPIPPLSLDRARPDYGTRAYRRARHYNQRIKVTVTLISAIRPGTETAGRASGRHSVPGLRAGHPAR